MIVAAIRREPVFALVVGWLAASFGIAYWTERRRLLAVMRATASDLNDRADAVTDRMARAVAEEASASYDPTRWGEA